MNIIQSCPHGCTVDDLQQMGISLDKFYNYMWGKTNPICNGCIYDHDLKEYKDSSCKDNPHGSVYFNNDVLRYLNK